MTYSSFAFAQEVYVMFNSKGSPVAYIDTVDYLNLYLWIGKSY